MNLRPLLAILVLFLLAGCAHSNSAGLRGKESVATDLDALVSNAKRDLAPRTLPNGKLHCMELSKTEKNQDLCGGDLEDTLLDSETDKEIGLANVAKAVDRIKLSINPCGFFSRLFRRSACRVDPSEPVK